MTFDLLKYTEDKVGALTAIPDETLGAILFAVLEKAGAKADRDEDLRAIIDESEIDKVLESLNLPREREAFYSYCARMGISVGFARHRYAPTRVMLFWSVQSVKEAKAKSTEDDDVMRNSREEPLLPIGSLGNVVEHSNHRGRVVEILAYEKGDDYYIVGYKGSKLRLPCSDVTAYTGD